MVEFFFFILISTFIHIGKLLGNSEPLQQKDNQIMVVSKMEITTQKDSVFPKKLYFCININTDYDEKTI